MNDLDIRAVQNGFIVNEPHAAAMMGRQWVFETPEGLADFVKDWGIKRETERGGHNEK